MEITFYLKTLWKWSWLIALSTIVATASSYWATTRMPRIYRTSTTLMVGRALQTADPTGQDFAISQQLAQSYLQLVRRQPVLQGTMDALGLDLPWQWLAEQVNTSLVPGTQLLQISVQDTDPQRAKALADEIARQLILQSPTPVEQEQSQHRQFVSRRLELLQAQIQEAEQQMEELEERLALENSARGIQDIQGQLATLEEKISTWETNYASLLDFFQGSRTNYLSVVEPAVVPTRPVSPNVKYHLLLAAAIGFSLAAGAAFLLEFLDNTIKSSQEVDRLLHLPTLGTVARLSRARQPSDNLVTLHDTSSPTTEAYRDLRTKIQFASFDNPQPLLLVTSAGPGEGKTTTVCNLAITMAYAGKRVLLVDADLRCPAIHRFFEVSNQTGLTSLLLDERLPLAEILVDTPLETLRVLSSGPIPPNPSELLGSEPMQRRLEQMKEVADIILFDSPPVLAVTDAAILAARCSGLLLVIDSQRTRSQAVQRTRENLAQLNLKILGVVLNKVKARRGDGYYYYHYYSHSKSQRRHRSGNSSPEGKLLQRLTHSIRSNHSENGHAASEKEADQTGQKQQS